MLRIYESSSAMADRPCDCLCPKSPWCSCLHYQWFRAGWDAVAIRQARITRPKRHLPNAYEILVTWYDQFRMRGGSVLANISQRSWCHKTKVIAISCGIEISTVHHLVLSQYTRLTGKTRKNSVKENMKSLYCMKRTYKRRRTTRFYRKGQNPLRGSISPLKKRVKLSQG